MMHNSHNKGYFLKGIFTGVLLAVFGGALAYKKRNRIKAKLWMWKIKSKVYSQFRKLKNPSQTDFEALVDSVVDKYRNMKGIGREELDNLTENLKGKWEYLKRKAREEMEDMGSSEEEDAEEEEGESE